jgi:hypothetical protein
LLIVILLKKIFDPMGGNKLNVATDKLGSELLNLSLMFADGEVLRLYLGPMSAPDQLGRDKLCYREEIG